jgi:hypothetical protein
LGIVLILVGFLVISIAVVLYGAGIGLESIARGTLPLAVFGAADHRATALGGESKSALRILLPLQTTQSTQFVTADRVHGGLAQLRSPDVHFSPSEVDVGPFQVAGFRCPQTMSPDREQHRIVTVPVSVAPGGLEELLAFGFGEILAFAGNCPLFCGWCLPVLTHVLLVEQSTTVRILARRLTVCPAWKAQIVKLAPAERTIKRRSLADWAREIEKSAGEAERRRLVLAGAPHL